MEHHICACCGGQLEKRENDYYCPYCRSVFEDDAEERAAVTLAGLLDDQKLEKLSNARRLLFQAAHEEFASNAKVLALAKSVREIYPADDYAILYQTLIEGNVNGVNNYLLRGDMNMPLVYETYRFVLANLDLRFASALKTMSQRYLNGDELRDALTLLEEQVAKLEEGIFEPSLPRDIFLAYSSADQARVTQILNFLEDNGFTVFAAFRNLRHGVGAADNYLSNLQAAMKHCKVLVFVSSEASRSLS